MTEPEQPVACPLPGCGAPLSLITVLARALTLTDLVDEANLTDDADRRTWSVACEDGHVVLLPSPTGCSCDDLRAMDCPHAFNDFDWSETYRSFRPHDLARLGELCVVLNGVDEPHGH
jgi:hypothetical protein